MLGALQHSEVCDVLNRGHIFLNTSLTESFCIAILEAACCGLFVVSTNVGGVPEVLPSHMCYLCEPTENDVLRKTVKAINNIKKIDTTTYWDELRNLYSWHYVAERTEHVYDYVLKKPQSNILSRCKIAVGWGSLFLTFLSISYMMLEVLTSYLLCLL